MSLLAVGRYRRILCAGRNWPPCNAAPRRAESKLSQNPRHGYGSKNRYPHRRKNRFRPNPLISQQIARHHHEGAGNDIHCVRLVKICVCLKVSIEARVARKQATESCEVTHRVPWCRESTMVVGIPLTIWVYETHGDRSSLRMFLQILVWLCQRLFTEHRVRIEKQQYSDYYATKADYPLRNVFSKSGKPKRRDAAKANTRLNWQWQYAALNQK